MRTHVLVGLALLSCGGIVDSRHVDLCESTRASTLTFRGELTTLGSPTAGPQSGTFYAGAFTVDRTLWGTTMTEVPVHVSCRDMLGKPGSYFVVQSNAGTSGVIACFEPSGLGFVDGHTGEKWPSTAAEFEQQLNDSRTAACPALGVTASPDAGQ